MPVEALVKAEVANFAVGVGVGAGVGHGGHTGVEPDEGTTVMPTGRLTIPPELALMQEHPDCALVYKPPPLQLLG